MPTNLGEQFRSDYQRYAVYVEFDRIMTDIRDGLKPVQRKIIYDMLEIGATKSKTKSANVVGSTLAKYHSHGDTSLYETMCNMANWFECYMPLISKQGNFGTIQGHPPAAYRYTECCLSPFALECIVGDLIESKQCVDWSPNYSNTCLQPNYLPCAVPLLLINGSFGIGVGKKVEIPSYNINEVIDATITLIQNPDANVVLVPDTCLPCEIFDDGDWQSISENGFGFYTVRGITSVETFSNDHYKNRPAVVIKSVPDLTKLTAIQQQIEALVASKKIVQIDDVLDFSSEQAIRLVLVLKQGADPEYVRNVIYQNTQLQRTVRINFEMLNGLEPIRPSYKEYLKFFIQNRKDTKYRVFINRLRMIETRMHEKEAFIKLLESGKIDEVVERIRKFKEDEAGLVEYLIKLLSITDIQAKYIINANLKGLTIKSLARLKEDMANLSNMRDQYRRLIMDSNALTQFIIKELLYIKEKYGFPRKSKIIHNPSSKDAIPNGSMLVAITEKGYIKKVPTGSGLGTYRNDTVRIVSEMDNADNLILFDASGKAYKLPIHKLPFGDRSNNGIDLRFVIKNTSGNIVNAIPESVFKYGAKKSKTPMYVVTLTKTGMIKRMEVNEFLSISSAGLSYIKLDSGDIVQYVMICNDSDDILVFDDTRMMRIPVNMITVMKRAARGNRTLRSMSVDGMIRLDPSMRMEYLIIVTRSCKVNKIHINDIPGMQTVRKEFSVIRLAKNDAIQNIMVADDVNKLVIRVLDMDEQFIEVSTIPIGSSISGGERVLKKIKSPSIIYTCIR